MDNNTSEVLNRMISDGQITKETVKRYFPWFDNSDDERIIHDLCVVIKTVISNADLSKLNITTPMQEMFNWVHERGSVKPTKSDKEATVSEVKFHDGDVDNPYDMPYSDAEKYISDRGFDISWCDCDVFVDGRYVMQTVANVLRWADNHRKGEELLNEDDYGIDGLYHAIQILERTLGEVEGYQTDDGMLEQEVAIDTIKKIYQSNTKKG